jgi:gluconate 2-dehydrogenase gamma chain
MPARSTSRRRFLVEALSGAGAAWFAANHAGILEAGEFVLHAQQAGTPAAFRFFTPAQAADVEAMSAQIIPTDDTPGAREANVVGFIDRALTTFEQHEQASYTTGLAALQAEVQKQFPGTTRLGALTQDQQIKVLTAIERTPFFNLVRTHTISGFFAHPIHGGNAGNVGWQLVKYDHSLNHTPPFGYYDAQVRR